LVFEIWCLQGFRDAQTHALTNGQTRMQYAFGAIFQHGRGIKLIFIHPVQMYTIFHAC